MLGTRLSLQRTRHVNTSSLAGLLDKVWPIGQLPVNKISVLYHPLLHLPDFPSPLHVQITTAGQCFQCVGESEPGGPPCYFLRSLTVTLISVLPELLSSCVFPLASPMVTNQTLV